MKGGQAFLPVKSDRMNEPRLTITQRHLPHWTLPSSTYYLTFRLVAGKLSADERRIVLNHIRLGDGRFYDLAAAMVMPNHVHAILKPRDGVVLSNILKGIKGVSARLLNQRRNTRGRVWQEESWDRIMRNADEFDEKLQYTYENPVRAGLVSHGGEYDGWYCNPDFA
jgi:putative transposase